MKDKQSKKYTKAAKSRVPAKIHEVSLELHALRYHISNIQRELDVISAAIHNTDELLFDFEDD